MAQAYQMWKYGTDAALGGYARKAIKGHCGTILSKATMTGIRINISSALMRVPRMPWRRPYIFDIDLDEFASQRANIHSRISPEAQSRFVATNIASTSRNLIRQKESQNKQKM